MDKSATDYYIRGEIGIEMTRLYKAMMIRDQVRFRCNAECTLGLKSEHKSVHKR